MRNLSLAAILALLLGGCTTSLPFFTEEVDPEEYEPYWRAARDCFLEASVILHDAALDLELTSLDALVWAEDKIGPGTRRKLFLLSERGTEWAERAVAARPDGAEGRAWLALNLAMGVAGRTRTQAFFAGLARAIRNEYERALEIDPTVLSGGILRLKGKFLTLAPWPYRDHDAAVKALKASFEVARVPMTAMLLGDTHHLREEEELARKYWAMALDLPPHQSTRFLNDRIREMARRRLAFPKAGG